MASRFLNKVAVVTASTEGIGFSIARRLAKEGAKVVISSRKKANVEKAVEALKKEKLECHGLVCHVGKAEDRKQLIDETVKKYGGIDVLVSNAATNPHMGPLFDIEETAWDKIFEINVKSTFFLIKRALPHLQQRKDSSILVISSIAAYNPFPLIAPYSISKTALVGMIKAMAPPCAEMGIRVNGIAPGVIKTNFSQVLWQDNDLFLKSTDSFLRRPGETSEIDGTAAFLCSSDASYITGETIIVNGGSNSRL